MSFTVTRGPVAPVRTSPAAAAGCLMIFSVPFLVAGIFLVYQAIRRAVLGDGAGAIPTAAGGAVFAAVGVTMLIGSRATRRKGEELEARRGAAPGQPWLWREDWANRRIPDSGRTQAATLFAFALIWNLISLPAAWFAIRGLLQGGDAAGWLVLLFPAVGSVLLVAAAYSALQARRYGRSILELSAVPAPIGRELAGTIHITRELDPEHGVQVTLSCIRVVVSGSGKNRSTREQILWQDEQSIAGLTRQYDGVGIPVRVAIPADAEPCDDSDPSNRVLWRLVARASTPGVDYGATFEVPVFRTAESAEAPPAELVERHRAELAEYRLPPQAPVRLRETGRGVRVEFPMARNPGAALGLTAFGVIWSGVFILLFRMDAPWFFRVAFGGFDLLILAIAAALWFGRATIEAGREGLTITTGVGPFSRTRSFAASEVARIVPKIGMTAGNRAYFDLRAVFVDQSSVGAGSGLSDRRQAEWVADRIMKALGKAD
jgi:hypothetical protein